MTSVSPGESSIEIADELSVGRTPWSPEAEQAVLGAMMLDADASVRALGIIDETVFWREAHRKLFLALRDLAQKVDITDPVVLYNELIRRGELEDIGGKDYINILQDVVPTAAHVEYHCKILKDKALMRQLIATGEHIVRAASEGHQEIEDLLDDAEQKIFEVSAQRVTQETVRIKELMWEAMERIEARSRGGHVGGVLSGFKELDEKTNGFHNSDLIIIAARPSMGKTSLCLNIAATAAMDGKVPVAIFSLEMSREQLVERLIASEAFVDLHRLRSGKLRDEDYPKLSQAAGLLGTAAIWIDDTPSLSIFELRSKARRLKAEHDIGLIVIDYLQLLHDGMSHNRSRNEEISNISRALKALARELKVPVITLSQLSRAAEQRGGDKRPMLSDLRDSGAIEQDADLVIFIYRAEMYRSPDDAEGENEEGLAELILAKHRNGPTGMVKLAFIKQYTRFDNLSRRPPRESQGGYSSSGAGGDY